MARLDEWEDARSRRAFAEADRLVGLPYAKARAFTLAVEAAGLTTDPMDALPDGFRQMALEKRPTNVPLRLALARSLRDGLKASARLVGLR